MSTLISIMSGAMYIVGGSISIVILGFVALWIIGSIRFEIEESNKKALKRIQEYEKKEAERKEAQKKEAEKKTDRYTWNKWDWMLLVASYLLFCLIVA